MLNVLDIRLGCNGSVKVGDRVESFKDSFQYKVKLDFTVFIFIRFIHK